MHQEASILTTILEESCETEEEGLGGDEIASKLSQSSEVSEPIGPSDCLGGEPHKVEVSVQKEKLAAKSVGEVLSYCQEQYRDKSEIKIVRNNESASEKQPKASSVPHKIPSKPSNMDQLSKKVFGSKETKHGSRNKGPKTDDILLKDSDAKRSVVTGGKKWAAERQDGKLTAGENANEFSCVADYKITGLLCFSISLKSEIKITNSVRKLVCESLREQHFDVKFMSYVLGNTALWVAGRVPPKLQSRWDKELIGRLLREIPLKLKSMPPPYTVPCQLSSFKCWDNIPIVDSTGFFQVIVPESASSTAFKDIISHHSFVRSKIVDKDTHLKFDNVLEAVGAVRDLAKDFPCTKSKHTLRISEEPPKGCATEREERSKGGYIWLATKDQFPPRGGFELRQSLKFVLTVLNQHGTVEWVEKNWWGRGNWLLKVRSNTADAIKGIEQALQKVPKYVLSAYMYIFSNNSKK